MNLRFWLLLVLISLFFFQFCEKKQDYIKPDVIVVSPDENDSFDLPGIMLVELSVVSNHKIKFVRIGVENSDYQPLFTNKFFYLDSNIAEIVYDLEMDVITQDMDGPFYLHIAVDDGIQLTHTYVEVILNNVPIVYKGFYLFTRPTVNQTAIAYFDNVYNSYDFNSLNGEYIDAEASSKNDMLFVSTTVPGKLYAFKFEDQVEKWAQEPESPYPDYTDLYHDGSYLYVGYANERIAALDESSGVQKLGTKILVDSVPMKIGISDNYFIGDFEKRTSPGRAWVSFYRLTGRTFQSLQSNISVVDFYPSSFENAMDVIGNIDGSGVLIRYYFEPNETGKKKIISLGQINNSCRIDKWYFLISINDQVYKTSVESGTLELFVDYPGEIIDLQFDYVNSYVFVARQNQIEVYTYPGRQRLETLLTPDPIKAIRLRYGR